VIDGWEEKRLGDTINLKRGYDLPMKDRIDGEIPIFSSSGVSGLHAEAKAAGPGVITGRYGTIGSVFYSEGPFWPLNTTLYVQDFKGSHPRFIYYLLQTLNWEQFNDKSAVPGINRNDVHDESILVPLPNEQKAIAEVLSSLDDKIDLLHRQNATLDALAETLFRKFFVEEAQDDWEEATVSDFADHSKNGVKPQENPDILFSHYSLPAFDSGKVPASEYGRDIRSGKYQVPDNSILISKLNPEVSRIWLIGKQESSFNICSTEFQVAKPSDPNHLPFLYCLFKSRMMRDALTASAGGTSKSHQRVNPADIFGYAFLRPPYDLIESFAAATTPMFEKLLANQGQIQTLERLRDTLLPKLMSGEVRVQLGNVAA